MFHFLVIDVCSARYGLTVDRFKLAGTKKRQLEPTIVSYVPDRL